MLFGKDKEGTQSHKHGHDHGHSPNPMNRHHTHLFSQRDDLLPSSSLARNEGKDPAGLYRTVTVGATTFDSNDTKSASSNMGQAVNELTRSMSAVTTTANSERNSDAGAPFDTVESRHTFDVYDLNKPHTSNELEKGIVGGDVVGKENQNGSNVIDKENGNNDDTNLVDEIDLEGFSMTRLRGIHSTTKKLAENQLNARKWNWNELPLRGNTCLIKSQNYNIMHLEIDGQMKQIKYNPEFNARLSLMDIIYSFNQETKVQDCLLHSKERLKSFTSIIVQSLKASSTKHSDSTSKVSLMGKTSILSEYSQEAGDNIVGDLAEVGTLVHLWYLQLQKFLLQKNSLFYSNEALQSLLKKKSISRKTYFKQKQETHNQDQARSQNSKNNDLVYIQQDDDFFDSKPKPVLNDPIEEIDILVIRPQFASLTSLQLAIDEPSLNIADYQLNSITWNTNSFTGPECRMVDSKGNILHETATVCIVSDENELKYLTRKNADKYITDCMGKPIQQNITETDLESLIDSNESNSIKDDSPDPSRITLPQSQKSVRPTVSSRTPSIQHGSPILHPPPLLPNPSTLSVNPVPTLPHLPDLSTHSLLEDSRPHHLKKTTSSRKKSSFVNFFRRKHPTITTSSPSSSSQQEKKSSALNSRENLEQNTNTTSSTMSSSKNNENNDNVSTSNQASSHNPSQHQTVWLEEYFGQTLSNYKNIDMPTQYYLPSGSGSPVSPANISSSEDESINSKDNLKSGSLYNQQYLQLKLPFSDNSIPSIYSPWVWGMLPRNKWHALTKEIFRVLKPEGYALAVQSDMTPTNSNPLNSKFEYSIEKDKIFDSVVIGAMNQNLYIHPTKHLTNAFKQNGFTNIKTSVLSLKMGDFSTEMGCLNEFACLMALNFVFRHEMERHDDTDKDPGTILEQYVKEHWGCVDDAAGTFRLVYVVAQKPKRLISL